MHVNKLTSLARLHMIKTLNTHVFKHDTLTSACTHNTSSNRRMHVLLIILQQTLIVSPHPAKLRCCLCEGGVDHLRCYLNAHWSRQDNACMCVSLHSGQTERKCNISEIEIAVFTAAPIFPCEICTFPKGFYAAVNVLLFYLVRNCS